MLIHRHGKIAIDITRQQGEWLFGAFSRGLDPDGGERDRLVSQGIDNLPFDRICPLIVYCSLTIFCANRKGEDAQSALANKIVFAVPLHLAE